MKKKKVDYRKFAQKHFKNPSKELPLVFTGVDICKKCKRLIKYCNCNGKQIKT